MSRGYIVKLKVINQPLQLARAFTDTPSSCAEDGTLHTNASATSKLATYNTVAIDVQNDVVFTIVTY